MSIIDKDIFEENKKFYEQYPEVDDVELSEEQLRRIDEIYEKTIDLIAFLTNKKKEDFIEKEYFKASLVIDTISEVLKELGETVYIPTIIEDEDGTRTISDTF